MAYRAGRCTNDLYCSTASARQNLQVPVESLFVCPQCGKPLSAPSSDKRSFTTPALLATGGLVICAGALFAAGSLISVRPVAASPAATPAGSSDIHAETPADAQGETGPRSGSVVAQGPSTVTLANAPAAPQPAPAYGAMPAYTATQADGMSAAYGTKAAAVPVLPSARSQTPQGAQMPPAPSQDVAETRTADRTPTQTGAATAEGAGAPPARWPSALSQGSAVPAHPQAAGPAAPSPVGSAAPLVAISAAAQVNQPAARAHAAVQLAMLETPPRRPADLQAQSPRPNSGRQDAAIRDAAIRDAARQDAARQDAGRKEQEAARARLAADQAKRVEAAQIAADRQKKALLAAQDLRRQQLLAKSEADAAARAKQDADAARAAQQAALDAKAREQTARAAQQAALDAKAREQTARAAQQAALDAKAREQTARTAQQAALDAKAREQTARADQAAALDAKAREQTARAGAAPPPAKVAQAVSAPRPTRGFSPAAVAGGAPAYPSVYEGEGRTGRVTVSCLITNEGAPTGCHVVASQGGIGFNNAALSWLRSGRVRFNPVVRNGETVSEEHSWSMSFEP